MTGSVTTEVQFTGNDIEVGARVVEALVHHAKATGGAPIVYKDLLRVARIMYPKDVVLDRAVAVGIGTKLLFVEAFCAAHGYPNLACLAVNRTTMRPAGRYQGDWDADQRAVAACDWSAVDAQLAALAKASRANVRLKPRKERPADVSWYAYFCSHRKECAWIKQEDKQEIVNLIMAGIDPDTAMKRVHAARADIGDDA